MRCADLQKWHYRPSSDRKEFHIGLLRTSVYHRLLQTKEKSNVTSNNVHVCRVLIRNCDCRYSTTHVEIVD
jgi:hypothetical protein